MRCRAAKERGGDPKAPAPAPALLLALLVLAPGVALLAPRAAAQTCDNGNLSNWTLPDGFTAQKYHDGSINSARSLAISNNSKLNGPVVVYVSTQDINALFSPVVSSRTNMSVYAMVDQTGRGAADWVAKLVDGAQLGGTASPNGIAWCNGTLYIAAIQPGVWFRLFKIDNVDSIALANRSATAAEIKLVRDDMPNDAMHGWKYIKCDAKNLYIPIGANQNIALMNGSAANANGGSINITSYSASRLGWVLQSHLYQKNSTSYAYEYAAIYRYALGSTGVTATTVPVKIARGVRNTVGFDFDGKGNMYFTDNGRDNIGGTNQTITNNAPDCELNYLPNANSTTTSTFFGYPYCHTGSASNIPEYHPYLRDPGVGRSIVDPDTNLNEMVMKCNDVSPLPYKPAIQAQGPHMAPLGAFLYQSIGSKGNFPSNWSNTLFVCEHGSWNRDPTSAGPIGAKVTAHKVNNGVVTGYSSFFSGGVPGDKGGPDGPQPLQGTTYTGRPVDTVELPDGSLLVSDDFSNRVVRIAYCKSSPAVGSNAIYGTGRCGTYQRTTTEDSFNLNYSPKNACTVNMGNGVLKSYARCQQVDLASPSKIFAYLAYNLKPISTTTLLFEGALIVSDYIGVNGNGWAAVGPKAQEDDMENLNVVLGKVAATATGAGVTDYNLGTCYNPSCFTASTPGFFYAGTISAALAGKALVLTYGVTVPKSSVTSSSGYNMNTILAMGNFIATSGAIGKHFLIDTLNFKVDAAAIGVTAPLGVPINKDTGVVVPSTPSNGTVNSNCSTNPCCVNGVAYQFCATTTDAGVPITHYYTLNSTGKILTAAIKGDVSTLSGSSKGWIAWGYNKKSPGTMLGTEALFVRYQGAAAADSVDYILGGYSTSAFTAPAAGTSIYSSVSAWQLATGELLLNFQVNLSSLPTGLVINYAAGPYNGGTGATGMGVHITPAAIKACVNSYGFGPVGCSCV